MKKEEVNESEIVARLRAAKEYLEEELSDEAMGYALATIYLALLDGE